MPKMMVVKWWREERVVEREREVGNEDGQMRKWPLVLRLKVAIINLIMEEHLV